MATNGRITRLLDSSGRPMGFDYDAVQDKKRRQPPRIRLLSEDRHLPPADRKKLVATGRDIVRNWVIACWSLDRHLDNVACFTFNARSPNESFNRALEERVNVWKRGANFDVAGRHGLDSFVRMAEARRTLDGDVFPLKLSSGRIQAVEGDRIRTPRTLPEGVDPDRVQHGVVTTKAGAARGYCLHNRGNLGDSFEFDRIVPARHMIQHACYPSARFDQIRGVSRYAAALNGLQDCYEGLTYATVKAKLAQMWGVKAKLVPEEEESPGDVTTETDSEGNVDKSKSRIDLGRAPFYVELDPQAGEDVEIVESSHPAVEMQEFVKLLILIALKAVNIPYCWFDQKGASWSANRADWVLYDMSAEPVRNENRELLNRLLAWRIGLWIVDDELVLPKNMSLADLRWEWISRKMSWVDPQKEARGWQIALGEFLTSRTRICKAMLGVDFKDVVDEIADELAYLAERGLGPGLGQPIPQAQSSRFARRRAEHVACYKDYLHAAA